MSGGFFRGLFIGTMVGTFSGMLMDQQNREKARSIISQGNNMFHMAEDGVGVAESWIDKGRRILYRSDQFANQNNNQSESDYQMSGINPGGDNGKENINRRVAVLEQRLEELSQRGV